jgi:parallel beta-helix repeat protein
MNTKKGKILTVMVCIVMCVTAFVVAGTMYVSAQFSDVWVDDDYPHNEDTDGDEFFRTIGAGINNVAISGTVHVYAGTYSSTTNGESFPLKIGKSITLQGEDRDTTIIDGNGSYDVIEVLSSDVTITGFEIKGGSPHLSAGIAIDGCDNIYITHNRLLHNYEGIRMSPESTGIHINDNIVRANDEHGILIFALPMTPIPCWNLEIKDNTIIGNRGDGIHASSRCYLDNTLIDGNVIEHNSNGIILRGGAYENTITDNRIAMNLKDGINIYDSSTNKIGFNKILENGGNGIVLSSFTAATETYVSKKTNDNSITCNDILRNGDNGIAFFSYNYGSYSLFNYVNDNTISHNRISDNDNHGIYFYSYADTCPACINDNKIYWNSIMINEKYGIYLELGPATHPNYIESNKFYRNNIAMNGRSPQAYDEASNHWDDDYPACGGLGGNWWSDYTGADEKHGHNQDQDGADGIGDTPYVIDIDSQDNYPYMGALIKDCKLSHFLKTSPIYAQNVFVAEDGGKTTSPVNWALSVTLPDQSHVRNAFLYLSFRDLDESENSVVFDGNDVGDPYNWRIGKCDQWSTARFDVTNLVPGSGSYTVRVDYNSGFTEVYGATLVVIYEVTGIIGAPKRVVFINDGCLRVSGGSETTTFAVDSTAKIIGAKLTTMVQSGSASLATDELLLNTNLLVRNPFDGSGGLEWDVDEFDVANKLAIPSRVTFVSGNDDYISDVAVLTINYRWWPPIINETVYLNYITQSVDVSKIRFVLNAVNEEWVKGSKWPKYAKDLIYWQKDTKYLINLNLNETGFVQKVDFRRRGNGTITEIPYNLAEQSLASLPPYEG